MASMQEALVKARLVPLEALERESKRKCVDDALRDFDQVVPNAFTLCLSLKEIAWRANPANAGKSHDDFIAHAREQLLSCV
ncbi:MAG: hypothetical protein WCS97_01815 [Candidatus Paceibacterota bacterium]|jgi:hypothetical protein